MRVVEKIIGPRAKGALSTRRGMRPESCKQGVATVPVRRWIPTGRKALLYCLNQRLLSPAIQTVGEAVGVEKEPELRELFTQGTKEGLGEREESGLSRGR